MPREEKLSSRLEILLDAIFDVPTNPRTLYDDIVTQLRPSLLPLAQKKIRKRLQAKEAIRPESAFLVASVLHLTGFPAQRVMHFLSLYVSETIGLSLFEFAVATIFRGVPPLPAALVYDITQYTYLEKRLLARKSMEITASLKDSLSAEVLLYLYLLSLRDDLSNENVQLIALLMKNCFPALEVRTRVGGATLEEYGEIARAWKAAEKRTVTNEAFPRSNADAKAFDRDNASYFLDKYFSDMALANVKPSVPLSTISQRTPRAEFRPDPAPAKVAHRPREEEPTIEIRQMRRTRAPETVKPDPPARPSAPEPAPAPGLDVAVAPARRGGAPAKKPTARKRPTAAHKASRPRSTARVPARPETAASRRIDTLRRILRSANERILPVSPVIIAAIAVGILMLSVPLHISMPTASSPASASLATAPAIGTPSTTPTAGTQAAATTGTPAPTPQATTPQAPAVTAPSSTYLVREGDSLWRIYRSLKGSGATGSGWEDFLGRMTQLNSLTDPNRIHPGSVLTLSAQKQ